MSRRRYPWPRPHYAFSERDLVIAILFAGLSIALIFVVLIDGFESMILPRRVARTFRFARLFYLQTWGLWQRRRLGCLAAGTGKAF